MAREIRRELVLARVHLHARDRAEEDVGDDFADEPGRCAVRASELQDLRPDEHEHPLAARKAASMSSYDVRAGSTKRVAAAVGEGAQVVAALHVCLADDRTRAGLAAAGGRR